MEIIRKLSPVRPVVNGEACNPPMVYDVNDSMDSLEDQSNPLNKRYGSYGSVRLKVPSRKYSLPPRTRLHAAYDAMESNNNGKKLWLVTNYPSHPIRAGNCARLHLSEENLRLFILSIILTVYMLLGALMMYYTERGAYDAKHTLQMSDFLRKYASVNAGDVMALLASYNESHVCGPRSVQAEGWSFERAFSLVASTLSTVGYGVMTPKTPRGRILLLVYSLFGCAGTILFFNLFLERVVTCFSNTMRWLHDGWTKGITRKDRAPSIRVSTSDEDPNEDGETTIYSEDEWAPTGAQVFLAFSAFTALMLLGVSCFYQMIEGWELRDAVYFVFVSFAAIGFGDFVPTYTGSPAVRTLYSIANFVILILGCAFVYSLFNIASLIMRQGLNWAIRKTNNLKCAKTDPDQDLGSPRVRGSKSRHLRKLGHRIRICTSPTQAEEDASVERVLSLKDFLALNHQSLLQMQKQFLTLSHHHEEVETESFSPSRVGPLGYLNERFDTESIKDY